MSVQKNICPMLTEFELCTAVLASTAHHVQIQYNLSHGRAFACDMVSLTSLLKRAADAVQINPDLLNQYKSIANIFDPSFKI